VLELPHTGISHTSQLPLWFCKKKEKKESQRRLRLALRLGMFKEWQSHTPNQPWGSPQSPRNKPLLPPYLWELAVRQFPERVEGGAGSSKSAGCLSHLRT
jgi:hypothetical protein